MALNSLVVAPFPQIDISAISATYNVTVSGTGLYIVQVQGLAQFGLTDGKGTENVLSNGQNKISDGNHTEVISSSQ